ncbi:MAG: hypothetical protein OEV94_02680 [Deltaproteobacteria bacterium]|nr:hypothetical protein [Deltaproteobacteria bacterium]
MSSIAETWFLWLALSGAIIGLLYFLRENQKSTGDVEMFTKEEFSVKTLLFGLKKGEGDIFIGYVLSIFFFSLFLMGFVRWFRQLL